MNASWKKVDTIHDLPEDMGRCVKLAEQQIAIFRIANTSEDDQWFAVQNLNPYNQRMELSRGIVGSSEHGPKLACPLHKNPLSLKDGKHLAEGELPDLQTYPIKVENDEVFLKVA
jgi:nitrite reductase (NADH) small subunit